MAKTTLVMANKRNYFHYKLKIIKTSIVHTET